MSQDNNVSPPADMSTTPGAHDASTAAQMLAQLDLIITSKLTAFGTSINYELTNITSDLYTWINLDKSIGKLPANLFQPAKQFHGEQNNSSAGVYGPDLQPETSTRGSKGKQGMRDLPRPEKFSGEDLKQDPEDFLASLNRLYYLADISTDKDRVGYAATCLTGPALTCINTITSTAMPAETRELLATWAGFQEELIAQFTPVNKTRNARDKLATCKQQDKESVRKYATRMREILITLPKVTEDEKLDRFIRNLKPDIRQEIEMTNPDSLDEAV